MRTTKLALALLGSAALLAGCANNGIEGIGLEKTNGFEDHREDIVVAASIESEEGEEGTGTARLFLNQTNFENNEFEVDGEAFYKVVKAEDASYADQHFTFTVYGNNPTDHVKCEIKTTGVLHPLHSNEAEGLGSATCVLFTK